MDGGLDVILRIREGFRRCELQRALLSIDRQTFNKIHLIAVVGGLSSEKRESLKDFIREILTADSTFELVGIHYGAEGGEYLNAGLERVKGSFVSFLDHDQIVYRNVYSLLIRELKQGECEIAFGGIKVAEYQIIDDLPLFKKNIPNEGVCRTLDDLWGDHLAPIHSCVFYREKIQSHDMQFKIGYAGLEDFEFLVRLCSQVRTSFRLAKDFIGTYCIKGDGSDHVIGRPLQARQWQGYKDGLAMLQRTKIETFISPSVQRNLDLSFDRGRTIALYLADKLPQAQFEAALYKDSVRLKRRKWWQRLVHRLQRRDANLRRSEKTLNARRQGKTSSLFTGFSDHFGPLDAYKIVADSGLFDSRYYLKAYSDSWSNGIAPLRHYLVWGGIEGRQPSGAFDSRGYIEANPALVASKEVPLVHYLKRGHHENEQFPGQRELEATLKEFQPTRQVVLLVSHDGSRTGAPMVAYNLMLHLQKKYDVIMLFLGGGPLIEACRAAGAVVVGPVTLREGTPIAGQLVYSLVTLTSPRFAIINSVVSRLVLPPLMSLGIPTVTLLHEFPADTRPIGSFMDVVRCSDATVLSSTLALENMLEVHPELKGRAKEFPIIAQGKCYIPKEASANPVDSITEKLKIRKAFRPKGFPQSGLVVVGLGTICYRKGVDLFLDCAYRVLRDHPELPIRFVWVGKSLDDGYSQFIEDQMLRAKLEERVEMVRELDSLDGVYKEADLFFLSSRLDPLPNVAIDALLRGVPTLCFEKTTGIADILRDQGMVDVCVSPYLDTAEMAEKIVSLARSPSIRREVSKRSRDVAKELFSETRYADQLIDLAERQVQRIEQQDNEIREVASSGLLNADYIKGESEFERARHYLRMSKMWNAKPFPGFHPGVYRERQNLMELDPLLDFIHSGKPSGPWLQPVIVPKSGRRAEPDFKERVALHIHAYYPDMIPEILERLNENQARINLLVSVATDDARQIVSKQLRSYNLGSSVLRLVPNRGRDLGPFLTEFAEDIVGKYDIIGHFHTKKTLHAAGDVSDRWVHFLSENLLGGQYPMADIILNQMVADPGIGMVFPDDPFGYPWGSSYDKGTALARRLGLPALPFELNFPCGSMFWARTEALRPLFDLKLAWDDYPDEPVPIDGTMLHAIERLLPLVVTSTGGTISVTNVPGVIR